MKSISFTDSQAIITGLQMSNEGVDKMSQLSFTTYGHQQEFNLFCHYPADTVQQVVSHWHWLPYVSTSVSGQLNQPSPSPPLLPRILLEAYFQGDQNAHLFSCQISVYQHGLIPFSSLILVYKCRKFPVSALRGVKFPPFFFIFIFQFTLVVSSLKTNALISNVFP